MEDILISRESISEKVKELGAIITKDYEGKNLVVIGVLKGSFIFMADLVREIRLPIVVDFIAAKSYVGTETTGEVKIVKDINVDVAGKDVLIVEDIIDSGFTLSKLKEYFAGKSAASVKICTALDKPERRKVKNLKVDYVGFSIPDEFVIGYGLDYDDNFRNTYDVRIYKP